MVSCDGLGHGGVQAVMMSIIRNLKKEYCFDMLLFTSDRRYYDDEFESYGGKIFRIPRYEGKASLRKKADSFIRGIPLYFKVLSLLKENGPYDVIHCHDELESSIILKAASDVGIPIRIAHTHIIHRDRNIIIDFLNVFRKKLIEKYATIKIACSKEASDAFYLFPSKAHIIYSPYDEVKFNISKAKVNKSKCFNILSVGNLCENKNQLYALAVLKHILNEIPNSKLILVGSDINNYKNILLNYIENNNLYNNVVFMPHNSNIPEIMSYTDIFLFPSKTEGFGIVLVEAQSMGIKCYASDTVPTDANCGGVTYISLNETAAFWANKISEDYRNQKCNRANYNVSHFSTSNIMQKYIKIYKGEIL